MKTWAVWIIFAAVAGIFFTGCTLFWEKGTLVRCPKCSTAFIIDDLPGQVEKRR